MNRTPSLSLTTTRRRATRTSGLAPTPSAGCLSPGIDSLASVEFSEGFEEDFTGWETGSDVPQDPNNPGNPVDWDITRSTERAASGSASLRYFLDGRQDDGTIWIVRPITVEPDQAYRVRMQADAWSASESFNTLAYLVMYAGIARPTSEGSFPEPGANSTDAGVSNVGGLREVLNQKEGWMSYSFEWETPTLQSDTINVAAGISAVWETEMSYFVDDIEVNASPK
jgi:hypothetical protein